MGMKIDSDNEKRQISKLEQFRQTRDEEVISKSLEKLRDTCKGDGNIMPPLIEALKLGATVGEVNGIMREVFGTWVSPSGV
jgi:methylmalonyl-CoA mutase N-terminal domain/subunit